MAQKKGQTGNPYGRPKGSKNKVTNKAKENLILFIENNSENVQKLFEKTAKIDPSKALSLYFQAIEYCIPKLARVEQEVEGDLGVTVNINYPI